MDLLHAVFQKRWKSAFQKRPACNSDVWYSENLQGDVAGVSTNLFLIPFIDLLGFKHLKVTKRISPDGVINAFQSRSRDVRLLISLVPTRAGNGGAMPFAFL